MGNCLSFGAEGTHEAEILQSPSMKDEAKAAGGYICIMHKRRTSIILATNCRVHRDDNANVKVLSEP